MKALTLIAAMALSFNVQATDYSKIEAGSCTGYSILAGLVMENRQLGGKIVDVLKAAEDDLVTQSLVIRAFKQPLWGSEQRKKSAQTEFESKIMIECLERAK